MHDAVVKAKVLVTIEKVLLIAEVRVDDAVKTEFEVLQLVRCGADVDTRRRRCRCRGHVFD